MCSLTLTWTIVYLSDRLDHYLTELVGDVSNLEVIIFPLLWYDKFWAFKGIAIDLSFIRQLVNLNYQRQWLVYNVVVMVCSILKFGWDVSSTYIITFSSHLSLWDNISCYSSLRFECNFQLKRLVVVASKKLT